MQLIDCGNHPFRWWRLAGIVDGDLLRGAYANIPPEDWNGWVRYSNDIERNKRTTRDLGHQHYAIANLAAILHTGLMPFSLGNLCGQILWADPDLHGGGLHVTDPGGWLQVHVDYEIHPRIANAERRLNLILWLNPEWRSEWGGALILCNGRGETEQTFYPVPGEGILFEGGPDSYHGAMLTSLDAPPRVSMAAYYLAQLRPTATRRRALFLPNRDAPDCPREVQLPGSL
jgi:hypothetical protein